MRDLEDLTFKTLAYYLSEATGIPSGQIWAKKPLTEFLTLPDGPNNPDNNSPYANTREKNPVVFPAISIDFAKGTEIGYNNYGESVYERLASGMVKEYKPLGQMKFYFHVTLLTQSRKDLRDYGLLLQNYLFETKYLHFLNDVFSGEYFNINFAMQREIVFEREPLRKVFTIECCARVLQEVTGYAVETVDMNIETTTYGGTAEEIIVYDTYTQGLEMDFEEGVLFERSEEV